MLLLHDNMAGNKGRLSANTLARDDIDIPGQLVKKTQFFYQMELQDIKSMTASYYHQALQKE